MYSLTIPLSLGTSRAGLTLKARLLDDAGSPVGSDITAGFVELGNGLYLFTYASFPDDFQGSVRFTDDDTEEVIAIAPVNPPPAAVVDAEAILSASVAGYAIGTAGGSLVRIGTARIQLSAPLV